MLYMYTTGSYYKIIISGAIYAWIKLAYLTWGCLVLSQEFSLAVQWNYHIDVLAK